MLRKMKHPEIVGMKKVTHLTGLSASTIYRMEKSGDFPKGTMFPINGKIQRTWVDYEVHGWIKTRPIVKI